MVANLEDLREKKLCYLCVGDGYLSAEIKSLGKRGKCSYCGETRTSQCLDLLSARIGETFRERYVRTSDQPEGFELAMLADRESDYSWDRSGERITEAIMDAADIPEKAASDIQRILEAEHNHIDQDSIGEETEFSSESYYEEKRTTDRYWQGQWRDFEKSIREGTRYFNKFATDHLASVFDGIDRMSAGGSKDLIVEGGPGKIISEFYRARAFQSDEDLKVALMRPDMHLGPPPYFQATAGRMNARGISVFYGANDPLVALAEVRPPVGSQVAVACFKLTRNIRLLDLTALGQVMVKGSIFDPSYIRDLERAMFLRSLSSRITKAVMPNDEPFSYIATQAISDFLATDSKVPIDGILFPSVQTGGMAQNVVLFHKSSRVEPMALPLGTTMEVSFERWTDEGAEIDYMVFEDVPPVRKSSAPYTEPASALLNKLLPGQSNIDLDGRAVTLKILSDSVRVHIVNKVHFSTDEHIVNRQRNNDSTIDLGF